MGLCQPARCGCAIQSRSIRLQGDGTTDNPYDLDTWYHIAPASTRYLTPAVGTAWTPDPGIGIPAGGVTIVAKVRKTVLDTATFAPIANQGETVGQYSWQLYIYTGYLAWRISANGTTVVVTGVLDAAELAAVMDDEEDIELAATLRTTGSNVEARGYHRPTGGSWTAAAALTTTAFTGTVYDSYADVRIGQDGTSIWDGRIYSVEMRTGVNPAAGTVIWRFDAEEHPGAGTAYTDPRGRDWYLDTAAVTPLPVEAVHGMQAYLPGANRIVRHDGNTWRTELAPLNPYTPVYTGVSLGGGATNLGGYTITDEVITVQGELTLGTGGSVTTSGITATLPAGLYPVFVSDAPWPANQVGIRQVGQAAFLDDSANQIHTGSVDTNVTHPPTVVFYAAAPTTFAVAPTNPFTWTTGDQIWWKVTYDLAPSTTPVTPPAPKTTARWDRGHWDHSTWG